MADIGEYIAALKASQRLGHMVVHHEVLPPGEAVEGVCRRPWPVTVERLLELRGIGSLYAHQVAAMDALRAGRNVVVATPTASGKTLISTLPVLEQQLMNPDSRALYLFPLKALAQDQLRGFEALVAPWPEASRPRAAIYDGDTSAWFRRKIRENPPGVLMTNPEMLHLALLAHHEKWAAFFAGLTHVVVDEVHTYRGVMGSHMAQVFRRLARVCRRYGSAPAFAFLSATVGNPGELARQLSGLDVTEITESGAPRGGRHFLFLNPALTMADSPSQVAILLLKAALARGLRTIVYTQSRRMTELIALWAAQRSGPYRERISAYRAGFLPEERRDIEARMASGELLAVISTSALELGIDIGSLDLCILVGYPGTVMQTLQRGGRVGRAQQDSAVALIAGEDQLDQYFMRNPRDFFARPPERAVLNPANPRIVERHLVCAAAEMPLALGTPGQAAPGPDAAWLAEPGVAPVLRAMLDDGRLLVSADGTEIHSPRRRPHREVDLRGAGGQLRIIALGGGEGERSVGQVDEHRACKETHPGAVYLHLGRTYVVQTLDLPGRTVTVAPARVDHYTRVRAEKSTRILSVDGVRTAWGMRVFRGRLRVTERITGYERRRNKGGTLLTVVPLDLPPMSFETEGLWLEIPRQAQRQAEDGFMHFMGGIHALEHAAIGILPLLVMTDRNDLGGISTPYHPQVGGAAVFVYDGLPGGVGLSWQAFEQAGDLLERTLEVVASCPCETGCPSCVHSPKCGSGNRPIDKGAARFLLEAIRAAAPPALDVDAALAEARAALAPEEPGAFPAAAMTPGAPAGPDGALFAVEPPALPAPPFVVEGAGGPPDPQPPLQAAPEPRRQEDPMSGQQTPATPVASGYFGVFDLETRRSAAEVGGWHRAERMGVSCACLYDSRSGQTRAYVQEELGELVRDLAALPLVVGFNIKRFDYAVLRGVVDFDPAALATCDMLEHVYNRLGYRLSLDHLAKATLGAQKSADGLQALAWWKEGRLDEIIAYCTQDVAVTRDLFLYGREHGHVLFTNKAKQTVRLPVSW